MASTIQNPKLATRVQNPQSATRLQNPKSARISHWCPQCKIPHKCPKSKNRPLVSKIKHRLLESNNKKVSSFAHRPLPKFSGYFGHMSPIHTIKCFLFDSMIPRNADHTYLDISKRVIFFRIYN